MIKVKLVHSAIGRNEKQAQIVRGLGLRKLYSERELKDTPSIRGMVAKIPHLVQIIEENITAKKKVMAKSSPKKAEAESKTREDEAK